MPYKQDPLPAGEDRADRALGRRRGRSTTALARPRTGRPCSARRTPVTIPEAYPVDRADHGAWRSAPTASAVAASGYHEVTLWKTADGTLDRRLPGLAERVYDIAYSPDGKWLATASGDPGQFGVATLWIAEPGGGGKPVRDLVETPGRRLRRRLQPRQQEARRRRRRPGDPDLGGRDRQAPRPDRGPRRLDLRRRLQPRRQAARQRQPRQDEQGLRRREEGVARHLPRPRPDGLHRRLHARRQGRRHRRRGQPDPGLEPRRRRPSRSAQIGGFGGPVFKLRYSPDGKTLVACSGDKIGPRLRRRQRRRSSARSRATTTGSTPSRSRADGKTLASGSWDGEVRLWNLADGKPLGPSSPPRATSPAGTRPRGGERVVSGRSMTGSSRETNLGALSATRSGFPLRSFDADLYFYIGRIVDHPPSHSGHGRPPGGDS